MYARCCILREVLFKADESYAVNAIDYSQLGIGDRTMYHPYYYINDINGLAKHCAFFSPDEEFITDEKSHGGSGMSGHGNVNIHFQKQSNT